MEPPRHPSCDVEVSNVWHNLFGVRSGKLCRVVYLLRSLMKGQMAFVDITSLFPFFFFVNVLFIFERDNRNNVSREGQRERETQNPKQAPGSELSPQSPMRCSNARTLRS